MEPFFNIATGGYHQGQGTRILTNVFKFKFTLNPLPPPFITHFPVVTEQKSFTPTLRNKSIPIFSTNYHKYIKIDRTLPTCLNYQSELSVTGQS